MKTGAEKVLEWMNKFYSQNGTPNFGEIVAQLEMAIDEEKLNEQFIAKDKFREDVENVRLRLSNRIDQLYTHSNEYKEAGDAENAKLSDLKARTLLLCGCRECEALMVLGDLDRILK